MGGCDWQPCTSRVFALRPDIQAFMSSSEDTFLLSTENNDHGRLHDVYLRFSPARKNIMLALVSGCIVVHCEFICSEFGLEFYVLYVSRFHDWDVCTFNTTDCQRPEFNRGGCQVIHFPWPFSKEDSFPVFSIAISMSILASSLAALITASYSTFCKFWILCFESCYDWGTFARHLLKMDADQFI